MANMALDDTGLIPLPLAMSAICPLCKLGDTPAGGVHLIPDPAMAQHFEEFECAAWPIVAAARKT